MLPTRPSRGPRRQRGLTLILMLIIITMGSAYLLLSRMSAISQRLGQASSNADVLMQAKQALIGYAAQDSTQPGALPCPDLNNNGYAENDPLEPSPVTPTCAAAGATANSRVGRLPWKTLKLPDLRDAAGERLWYALSANFTKTTTHAINSNTAGTLMLYDGVSGATLADLAVAVVIAPGGEISGQNRSVTGAGNRDQIGATVTDPVRANVANYLEGRNNYAQDAGGNNDDSFVQPVAWTDNTVTPALNFPAGACSRAGIAPEDNVATVKMRDCNDRVLAITHNDLFSVVENMVASRLQSAIATSINSYFGIWNSYPFPGTFADPAAYAGLGTAGVTTGLLPVIHDKANFTWITSGANAPAISIVGGGGALEYSLLISPNPRCTGSTAAKLSCDVRYRYNWDPRLFGSSLATVTITARINNLGTTFAAFPDPTTGTLGRLKSSHFTDNANYFTNTGQAVGTHVITLPAVAPYLNSDGTQTMTYSFTLTYQSSFSTRTMTLDSVGSMGYLDEPFVSALTTAGYGNDWFVRNQWSQLLLYSVATGYRPGGTGSCASPNCLTVTNLASPDTKGVVLVLAGRAIGAQARTTSAQRAVLGNYFEAPNSTAGTTTFTQNARSLTFNDRVVVVK